MDAVDFYQKLTDGQKAAKAGEDDVLQLTCYGDLDLKSFLGSNYLQDLPDVIYGSSI